MNINREELTPVPNNWFSTSVQYQGQGQATFLDPAGTLKGETTIKFDEEGRASIEMKVDEVTPGRLDWFQVLKLLNGEEADSTTVSFGGKQNLCTSLGVTTPQGTFSATDSIDFLPFPGNTGDSISVRFDVWRSEFEVTTTSNAKYWVVPLSNFLSRFAQRHPVLNNHVLRIFPTPMIPTELDGEDRANATYRANQKNFLILFKFEGAPGFIEPLPDYTDRKARLLVGQATSTITSLMVGEVGPHDTDTNFEALEEWFPFPFFQLLGLASGTEVGAPWIEFRDANGGLVKRIHVGINAPRFVRGQRAIDEGVHRGTGYLLTQATESPLFNETVLRVVIRNIIRGGARQGIIDNRLRYLFLAFETLIKYVDGADRYKLRRKQQLSPQYEEAVTKLLAEVREEIRELAKQAKATVTNQERQQLSDAEILERIDGRVAEAKTVRLGFEPSVLAVMREFELYDVEHIPKGRLYQLRGSAIHEGYIRFRGEGGNDISEVWSFLRHLHDILLRIVFKLLSYDGAYQPTVSTMTDSQPVDWVKPDMPASRFGYKRTESEDEKSGS